MMLRHVLITSAFLITCAISLYAQDKNKTELFNAGRTRCYFGGMSFSEDGNTLYHTNIYLKDSLGQIESKIATSTWNNNEWSQPVFTEFTPGDHESYPVWVAFQNRLYFSSYARTSPTSEAADLNIWYVEKQSSGWSSPVLAAELNSDKHDRLAFVDNEKNFYLIINKEASSDIFKKKWNGTGWATPEAVKEWNSPLQEEFVSVYPTLNVAFIQRTTPGSTTELFISQQIAGKWSEPKPLLYDEKTTQLPYVQRWPQLSPDLGTFYFVNHGLIWQQPTNAILKKNNIEVDVAYKTLPSKPRKIGEPELVGGMQLKTNNGISLTADMKTMYVSRYVPERDSTGNLCIKIFRSDFKEGSWSAPQLASINKQGVPFEYHPVLSPDGKRLFFNSRAPISGTKRKYESANNIWYVDKQPSGDWGEPVLIESLVTEAYDDYPSVTRDGTLYFRSDREGGKGRGDIYKSRYENGKYLPPENVTELNSSYNENDVTIDPSGNYIVFNRSYENDRYVNTKLFISQKTENGWSTPQPIPSLESTTDLELTPIFSPDGKYLYYEVNSNILRVETSSIFKNLKK